MTSTQRTGLFALKALFDSNRSQIEARHSSRVVGYVADCFEVADTVQESLRKVLARHRGKMVYFEPS